MKKILQLIFLLSFIQSCTTDNLTETTENFITIENVDYKVVQYNPNIDVCSQISNLTNDSYFEFTAGQVVEVSCNILLENKSNIIINGNGSILKYLDPSRIGFRIKVSNCNNILVKDLNIDNNDTKPNYTLDPTKTSVSGRIEIEESNIIEFNNMDINKQQQFGAVHGTVAQMLFKEVTNSTVQNCRIEYSDGELIKLIASKNCLVKSNFLNQGFSGISTEGFSDSGTNKFGHNNRIIDNTVTNSSTAFITINDRNAVVEGNHIYNDDSTLVHGPGIRFGHSQEYRNATNAICRNNLIENLKYPNGSYNPVGIKVDYTQSSESNKEYTDLIIENNTIRNCVGGIKVSNQSGQYLLVKNNQISTTIWPAIELFSSDCNPNDIAECGSQFQMKPQNCLASNNVMSSQNETIKIHNSSATITNNHISSRTTDVHQETIKIQNMYGHTENYHNNIKIHDNFIELKGNNGIYYGQNKLENSIIQDNIISNGNLGIYLGGKNNLIKGNLIQNCSNRSIYITTGSYDNTISYNDIYNNFQSSVYLQGTTGTLVFNNKFNFTGSTFYAYAVWKNNSPTTNSDCIIQNNTLINFENESN